MYEQLLKDTITLPGETPSEPDDALLVYLDRARVDDIPGFSKDRTLKNLGITEAAFVYDKQEGSGGYATSEGCIAIRRSAKYPAKVVWHELGHILLKHFERYKLRDVKQYAMAEWEAESVAYILCHVYGLNEAKAESRGYIQLWKARQDNKQLPAESVKRITEAVNQILQANR